LKKLLMAGAVALICALAALLPAGPARAQGTQGIVSISQPGGLMYMLIGTPQLVPVGTNFWIRPAGRFQFFTGATAPTGGDPTRTGDENKSIVSRSFTDTNNFTGFTSALQFSVDNTVTGATGVLFDTYAAMDAVAPAADPGTLPNYWPVPLASTGRAAVGTSLVPLTTTGPAGPSLTVFHNYELVGDALMLELVVTNTDTAVHSVGVRWVLNTNFGGANLNDGTSLIFPDGTALNTEAVLPSASYPSVGMPASWVSYDNPADPLVSVKGILNSAQVNLPGFANSSAGEPNALEIGSFARLAAAGFGFIPNPALSISGQDWGVGVKWNEATLAPGASRRFVTYLAFGASVGDYDPPFATMSYGPRRLQPAQGQDPGAPLGTTTSYYYTDGQGRSPFPMSVYADNFGSSGLFGATASINLPQGLTLSPVTQPRTQSLGTIPQNGTLGATWTVDAATARPGLVSVGMTGPQGRVVDRSMVIPAVPVLNPLVSATGLEMVSIPYTFTNNDAEHVFQSLGGLEPGQDGTLIRWNPLSLLYRFFPDPFVTNVQVGDGYWLLDRTSTQIVLPADAAPEPLTSPVSIVLNKGWNQIGNPFTLTTYLSQDAVINSSGGQESMIQAINDGLLQPTVFSFNPTTGQYEWQSDLSLVSMDPFVGYWILAYSDISLLVEPPSTVGIASVRPAAAPAVTSGWRASLTLSGGAGGPAVRSFGLAPNAKAGDHQLDLYAPPSPLRAGLQAAFVGPSGTGSPRLVQVQADNGTATTWYLKVAAAAPQSALLLSWPDLSAVPSAYTPVLEDTASGTRCYMRTTPAYRFSLAQGGSRLFKIILEPRGTQATLLTGVQAQATAGGDYSITYALSASASVDVVIRNVAGVIVRRVTAGQVAVAGTNTVLWNGRADSGSRVPAGHYLLELTARSPKNGQANSVIATLNVTR
jgi:hypothetical protein